MKRRKTEAQIPNAFGLPTYEKQCCHGVSYGKPIIMCYALQQNLSYCSATNTMLVASIKTDSLSCRGPMQHVYNVYSICITTLIVSVCHTFISVIINWTTCSACSCDAFFLVWMATQDRFKHDNCLKGGIWDRTGSVHFESRKKRGVSDLHEIYGKARVKTLLEQFVKRSFFSFFFLNKQFI